MRAEKKTPLLLFTHSLLLLFLSILKGLVIDSACFTLTHITNFPMFYHDKVCSKFLLLVFCFFVFSFFVFFLFFVFFWGGGFFKIRELCFPLSFAFNQSDGVYNLIVIKSLDLPL